MNSSPLTLCLVSPSHPTSNPRLLKEANALQSAGYRVHVIAGRYFPPLDKFDAAIYRAARWDHTSVDYTGGLGVTWEKLRGRLARSQLKAGGHPDLETATRAHHAAIPRLARAAARTQADLYIGHCLAGLAAAGFAAESTGAKLGFDAEDFHSAETSETEIDPVEATIIATLEQHWLPKCGHLTAASPLIANAYRLTYGIQTPVSLLNVFPLADAPPNPLPTQGQPARLYWFSQTIGPGRGLEALLPLLARLTTPCTLHLRGIPAPGFAEALSISARAGGFNGEIEFLPIAAPDEMVRLAADYDLGLSLEQSSPRNRDLCLTNKIFTYLLAGVPVALTPTSAQSELAQDLGPAALKLDLANPSAAAFELDNWLRDPHRRANARLTAWRLGRERYHWEHESLLLLQSVSAALSSPQ